MMLAGHSNASSVIRALVAEEDSGGTVALARRHGLGGVIQKIVRPEYFELVRELGRSRAVALIWQGNQANGNFLLQVGQPLDVIPCGYPETALVRGCRLVPEEAVRARFAGSVDELGALLAALGRPAGCRRYILSIQPPLGDNALIRERLHTEPHYAALAARFGLKIDEIPITAPSVRRKLWFILMVMYREVAERYGALFVDVPPEAFDERGFLRLDLAASDVTHPGLAYGRLMIAQLAAHLGS
ncbi:MAG: hypothetical protein IT548_06335 [Alphaproteobacteria bacterium]|nr:hypothetical protein [Alphaproteobacteria bacterium]